MEHVPGGGCREVVSRNSIGLPILNAKPVDCMAQPCKCDGPHKKPSLSPVIRRVWQKYRQCTEFGVLPRDGGLNGQNQLEMRFFEAFRALDDEGDAASRNRMIEKAGPLGLLVSMYGKGR